MNKKQLQRMLDLAGIKPNLNENKMSLSSLELVKKAADGKVYAIVKESKKYFIKNSDKTHDLVESDFNYIGGLANKPKYSYNSFEEATKYLNLMFEEINNHYNTGNINILESDDSVLSEKKYVLKLNKKKTEKPEETVDSGEEGGEFDFGGDEGDTGEGGEFDFGGDEGDTGEDTGEGGEFDFGGDEGDTGEEDTEDTGEFDFGGDEGDTGEGGDEDFTDDEDLNIDDSEDEVKDIQSTTGKLGQQLRDVEDLSSDMQKWVAKSVLSAIDLDNMDSEDKKDLIRTIKKKSEKEEPEEDMDLGDEGDTENFDFGGEEEVEESYDSYMGDEPDIRSTLPHLNPSTFNPDSLFGLESGDNTINDSEDDEFDYAIFDSYMEDNDPFDGMDSHNWGGDLNIDDIDMGIRDKGYLNLDDPTVGNPYESYMSDEFNESEFNSWMKEMEEAGLIDSYDSYMRDTKEDNPNIGGDEKDRVLNNDDENLLLDFDEDYDMGPEEIEALYGPNSTRRYSRSDLDRAGREADKDITKHYHKSAAPGYDTDPVEKWAKHKLPYDTKFIDESRLMSEDHLNDEMETYEQEMAYEDIEAVVRRYGMDVKLRSKVTSEDPEESLIYLDIVDGKKKLLVARINSVGDIEVGEMRGNKFTGEPVDSVEDFIEIFGEDLTNKEREDLNMDIRMNPQPQKEPDTRPSEPDTKPGKPERKSPSERPSRRPFSPPPTITPGDEPGPKAPAPKKLPTAYDDVEFE